MNSNNFEESEELQALSMDERLVFCSSCKNRSFSPKDGVVCGLNNEKPSFEYECLNYKEDEIALNRNTQIEDKKTYYEKVVKPRFLWIAIISCILIYLSYKYFDGLFSAIILIVGIVAIVKYFDK
ncbi:MAG TPA: hypothetical protein VGF79_03485 [Bacteroidia bacterium]